MVPALMRSPALAAGMEPACAIPDHAPLRSWDGIVPLCVVLVSRRDRERSPAAIEEEHEAVVLQRKKRSPQVPLLIVPEKPSHMFGTTVMHAPREFFDLRRSPLDIVQRVQPFGRQQRQSG